MGANCAFITCSAFKRAFVCGGNQYITINCSGDSCDGGEAHVRLNKMRARERKVEYTIWRKLRVEIPNLEFQTKQRLTD